MNKLLTRGIMSVMSELIDLNASGESLLDIIQRHCIYIVDHMRYFKGAPKTYIRNLQELAQELLTIGRFN